MAILYQLRCDNQHQFEGWFPSITQFESQKQQGLLRCPMCGIVSVDRAIMSPRLGKAKKEKSNKTKRAQQLKQLQQQVQSPNEMMMGSRIKDMMRTVRDIIKRECEFVGDRFVEEVKKYEHGERDDKFYGTPSQEEARKLMEEGVDLFVVPDVKDDA
jgi:hypothetical protein